MATDHAGAEYVAERLKDMAMDLDGLGVFPGVCARLTAVMKTGPDSWTTIEVHHAALLSESPDGWDVKITEGEL